MLPFVRALILTPFFVIQFAHSSPLNQDAVQRRFEQGILLMQSDPKQAVEIFKILFQTTGSIRIELELARSLYLSGNLPDAKAQFIRILSQPIPITVRDKVEYYLSEIQKQQSFKFVFGVFQDSNPGFVTSARTMSIMGQTLSYQPAQPTHSETALNIGAEAEREIIPKSGIYAQIGANTVTYQTEAFNKQTYDASVTKRWEGYNYKDLKVGYQTMYFGGYTLYNNPYISTRFVFNGSNQDYYGFNAKTGTLNYPSYTYLNGSQTLASGFYNHNITRNLTAYFEVGADTTPATQPAYSSHGTYATVGTQIAQDSTHLQATLKASLLQRNYWESDPFWGQVRRDAGQLYFFSLTKRNLYILGMRPSIDITYQANNSTIPFFTYNKLFGGIFFKNVY
jgi:hypothetical protein